MRNIFKALSLLASAAIALQASVVSVVHADHADGVRFKDVSVAAGLQRSHGPLKKYGGCAVADLDGNGYPDLLCGHHDARSGDLYFNLGGGTFTRSNDYKLWIDAHGYNPFRLSPREVGMHFVVSRGGNYGLQLRVPHFFAVGKQGHVKGISAEDLGVTQAAAGRGRSMIAMHLSDKLFRPDLILTNSAPRPLTGKQHNFAFEALSWNRLAARPLKGDFEAELNSYAMATDVDGDGRVELLSFPTLKVFKNSAPFTLVDTSASVLPRGVDVRGTIAVAELDFDNDGLWDIYIARTNTADLKWVKSSDMDDRLFRNIGGRYMDVTRSANIPRNTQSRGVTVGDFNNDGWVDILVTQYVEQDFLLLNNRDGTFTKQNPGFNRLSSVHGDMAAAVDYDGDGNLDVILSEGDWLDKDYGGYYRIMKNITPNQGNFILVRVTNAKKVISLHAVVTVVISDTSMMRRVGSTGTAVSNSYIELLHFGLGGREQASKVTVRWIDGTEQSKRNVKAGQFITF